MCVPTPIVGWLIVSKRFTNSQGQRKAVFNTRRILPTEIVGDNQSYAVQYPDGKVEIQADQTFDDIQEVREHIAPNQAHEGTGGGIGPRRK